MSHSIRPFRHCIAEEGDEVEYDGYWEPVFEEEIPFTCGSLELQAKGQGVHLMSIGTLRGTGSRLMSYDFSAYPNCITAKVSFEEQVSKLWDDCHELENFAQSTEREEDIEAANKAKSEAIKKGNEWLDYTKQAERHFNESPYGVQFFSVVANIIASTADTPDELVLLKESAKQFRNGKQSKQSGRVFGAMQFNSISHYMRFVDLCIENEEALLTIPAYVIIEKEISK